MLLLAGMIWGFAALAQTDSPGYHLEGTVSLPVPVSGMKMTNLSFPVGVASAVKVSKDVLMQRPKGVSNVIELKALRRNFPVTNITVYGLDGVDYSFALHFVEDTPVLNFRVVKDGPPGAAGGRSGSAGSGNGDHQVMFSGVPVDWVRLESDAAALSSRRAFLHRSVSAGGVRLRLSGIYLRDSLLWLAWGLRNHSPVGFTPAYIRVYVEDARQIKRTASQQAALTPVYASPLGTVPGRGTRFFAAAFVPFVPAGRRRLVVEIADADGGRVLVLRVKGKRVLRARVVK